MIIISSHALHDGVYPVTGYQIERSADGGTTWNIIVPNTASTGTWYSNYHLLASTAYSYRVSAINSVGTSSPSNTPSATTNLATVSDPPTGLATPFVSSSQISISWAGPLNDGGSPITGYKVERSTDGGTTWNIIVPNTASTGTWYSNYHLLASTAYAYRVSAINSVGKSSRSNNAYGTTNAATVPNQPTGLTTPYVSSSQISISWAAPFSDGGSPITGYKVERSADGGTTWNIIAPNTGLPGTYYSNYHLLASTTYTYRVSAINSVGTGSPSSTASATTSAATVPNPPTGLATPYVSSSQISISWAAPLNSGGSPITGYKIERSTDGGTTWTTIAPNIAPSPRWYSNYHLLASTAYTYRVSAINSAGTSLPSSTFSAATTATSAPAPPAALAISYVSSTQISISWAAPLNNGGSPITGYKIESSTDGGTTWNIIAPNTASTGTWYSNYNLLASKAYSYRVSAINSAGTGSPSSTFSATTHAIQTISLNPTTGPAGSSITVTGANFGSPSKITILYDNTVVTTNPATISTDSSGGFTATFTEPLPAAGPHTVMAKDVASNLASAKFTVFTAQIYKIQSVLVSSDSLITGDMSNWLLAGDAVAANAPHSGTEDSSGLHIGILTTAEGTWHGFEAISPLTTAQLFHAKINLPTAKPTTTGGAVDMDLYVQQEMFQNPHIDAIGCGATIYSDKVDWKTVVQQGNDKAVTSVQTVYLNSDPHPTTRDCTFVTDGHTMLKSYIDGQQVFSSNSVNPNMTKPFQSYLELQTNSKSPSAGQSYIGTFTDYYATTSDSIKVINAQAGSIVKVINATSGSTLASSTTDSSGTALVDVGKYHMPINANVVVYDSTGTNLLDSTVAPAGIYGGDVYNVGDSTVPQTTLTVNGFDSTTNAPLQGIYTTISTGQTNVATGFLPITYSGSTYAQYTVIPQNYGTQIFDHWDDGSTDRARVLDPTASSATLTAYYVDAHTSTTDVEPNSPTVQEGHQITFTVTVADQYAPSSIPP